MLSRRGLGTFPALNERTSLGFEAWLTTIQERLARSEDAFKAMLLASGSSDVIYTASISGVDDVPERPRPVQEARAGIRRGCRSAATNLTDVPVNIQHPRHVSTSI